jgi:O-antigen/teichoic acid export membrane protein
MKLFTSRFSVSLISLAFYGIAAHVVPKGELAPLAAMAIIAELFRVTQSLGMTSTMLRDVPEHVALAKTEDAAALVRSTLLYTALASLVLLAVVWFLRALIFSAGLLGPTLIIILAFSLLMACYDALQVAFLSLQWFGRQSLAYFITMAGQRLLALALLLKFGITGCLMGFLIGSAAGVIVSLFWARRYVFGGGRLISFPRLLLYSLPYYVQGFARYVFQEGDQLLVGIFFPPELLVSFFMAKRIVHGIRMMIDAATDALRPKMGELRALGEEAVRKGFSKSSRFLSYLALPVTLGVAAISRPLMLAYAGPQYADAGSILLVLSFAMAAYAYFSLYEVNIYMLGRPAQRLYVDLFAGGAMLGCFLVLAMSFAGLGIALAELVGFGVGLIFSAWLFRRISDARVDRNSLSRCVIASGTMFVIVGGASHWLQQSYFLPVLIISGGVIFVLIFTRLSRKSDMDEIRDALPKPFGWCVSALERLGGIKAETGSNGGTP